MRPTVLSPQIQEFIRRAKQGFDLREVSEGTFLEIETESDKFWMVVVNPSSGKVALKSTHHQLQEPQFFYHQGATSGGSLVKMGWMGVGFHLRMNPACGGLMTTSVVRNIKFLDNEGQANELVYAAEAKEPKGTVTEGEFNKMVSEIIGNFPSENQQEIRGLVDEFCPEGKGVILGILDRAWQTRKLAEALAILRQDFEEHWSYRPKQLRGSFVTEQDVYYVERAYRRLGIPSPSER